MSTHDALATIGTLKDHLAAHDRPLAFLFGAGTSACVNNSPVDPNTGTRTGFSPLIPGVVQMTDECQRVVAARGEPYASAWSSVEAECDFSGLGVNIETILGRVRSKLDAMTQTDTLGGLTRAGWQEIDDEVRAKIAALATPDLSTVIASLPHRRFTQWLRNTTRRAPVEVFTTNYDVLFETTFDHMRVPHFDGFVGSQHAYFSPETVENDALLPSPSWVRFWKLHGSVSWTVDTVSGEHRISRGRPTSSGEMVLPSNRKYDESRKQPYRSLMDRLGRVLARPNALLVVAGFSFGDQHINAIVLDALERYPTTHMIALTYTDIDEEHVVSKWALNLPKVLHIGPNAAVLRSRFGCWSSRGTPSDQAVLASGGLVAHSGTAESVRVKAGDFNAFASFLANIDGGGFQ